MTEFRTTPPEVPGDVGGWGRRRAGARCPGAGEDRDVGTGGHGLPRWIRDHDGWPAPHRQGHGGLVRAHRLRRRRRGRQGLGRFADRGRRSRRRCRDAGYPGRARPPAVRGSSAAAVQPWVPAAHGRRDARHDPDLPRRHRRSGARRLVAGGGLGPAEHAPSGPADREGDPGRAADAAPDHRPVHRRPQRPGELPGAADRGRDGEHPRPDRRHDRARRAGRSDGSPDRRGDRLGGAARAGADLRPGPRLDAHGVGRDGGARGHHVERRDHVGLPLFDLRGSSHWWRAHCSGALRPRPRPGARRRHGERDRLFRRRARRPTIAATSPSAPSRSSKTA